MNAPKTVPFSELASSDLILDAVYEGGVKGNHGDDPLHPLVGVGNAGGFRPWGRGETKYVALFSTQSEQEWPDRFSSDGSTFVYFGDQRSPGKDVEDTPRGGNKLLADVFARVAVDRRQVRSQIPPFFLFLKVGTGRDVSFSGLLVPAVNQLAIESRETGGAEFKNYRATFNVLRPSVVERAWLADLRDGNALTQHGPAEWFKWVAIGSA